MSESGNGEIISEYVVGGSHTSVVAFEQGMLPTISGSDVTSTPQPTGLIRSSNEKIRNNIFLNCIYYPPCY